MSYKQRLSFFIFVDTSIVMVAIYLSLFLVRTDFSTPLLTVPVLVSAVALLVSHYTFSFWFKLYRKSWEYASVGELIIIGKVVTLSILTASVIQLVSVGDVLFRLMAVTWMLHIMLIGGSRFVWRLYVEQHRSRSVNRKRTLIIGAGSAGTMVVRQLLHSECDLEPVAFIDDNPKKHHLDIYGIPVVGSVSDIAQAVTNLQIDNIIIAIPSLKKRELNNIFTECAKTSAETKILPMIEDLMTGRVSVNQMRDVQVEDLLGRDPVNMDIASISEYVTGKVVLVTGAGGSIGSEITRQVAAFHPRKLVLLGHGENSIYTIEMELRELCHGSDIEIVTEIADVQDLTKMVNVMNTHHPDVLYHAAAHKHVPLMERNPEEAVKNNIIGTMNVAKAASWGNVGIFVMISTDKAVNPTSVMGASKKLAEMIVQDMDKRSATRFVAVRFGNVLGSRGSVIPLFKKQIERGGPVTVTDPDMIRYFMTIPEASRLVIQAGALARGGEIFVLDMGDPVKIVDLATNLIKLSGYSLDEIDIEFTGMRPGEKLFEELLKSDEVHDEQVYPKIYVGKASTLYVNEIKQLIANHHAMDSEEIRSALLELANRSSVVSSPSFPLIS